MRIRGLVACLALTLVGGCGDAPENPAAVPTTAAPAPTSSQTGDGREAVDPKTQFVSFRRDRSSGYASGAALITGTLTDLDGCLVLEPGHQQVAFDADFASFDGTTLVLEPVLAGDPTVRVRLGEKVRFGGGYGDFADAGTSLTVAVPRACARLGGTELAYVEDWNPTS